MIGARHGSRLAVFGALLGTLVSQVGAQESSPKPALPRPAWLDELTPLVAGPHHAIQPAVATFKLSWNNVLNAGESFIVAEPKSTLIKGQAAGRSSGLARALWPYDFETLTETEVGTLLPLGFTHEDTERKERVLYQTGFDRRLGKIVTDTTFFPIEGKGSPKKSAGETELTAPETKRRVYEFTEVMDLLSTVLFIRSLELKDDDVYRIVVFPMNRPYHVTLQVLGHEPREIKGERFDTIKFDIQIQKVERDLTLKSYDKAKKATLWVTDDDYRMPLDLQANIFVGFISARSTGMDWIAPDETAEQAVERVRKVGLKGTATTSPPPPNPIDPPSVRR